MDISHNMAFIHKIAFTYLKTSLQITSVFSPRKAAQRAVTLFCSPRRDSRHRKPSAIINRAETVSCRINHLVIRGYRWNHPASKKILIAHGFESAAKNFEGYVQPLINLGYEVVAFDAPGHDRSEGNEIHLPLYVLSLQQIVNQFGPFHAYLGHSLGGLAVTHLAETLPQDSDTKIILIAPATETSTAVKKFFKLLHLNEKVRTEFERLAVERNGVLPEHFSVRRAIRNIKAQVLWLHDTQDDVTPFSDAEKVKNDQHPNIRFIISSGLGHSKIYRKQQTIGHVIQFLR